jgi:hypothetical protein
MTHDFEEFWKAYPKRPNNPKHPARLAWEAKVKAGVLPPQDRIIAAVEAYKRHLKMEKTEPKFICHTRTWISQERWEEWLTTDVPVTKSQINTPDFMRPIVDFMGLGFRLYENCQFACCGTYVSVTTDSEFVAERAAHSLVTHMERVLKKPVVVTLRAKT